MLAHERDGGGDDGEPVGGDQAGQPGARRHQGGAPPVAVALKSVVMTLSVPLVTDCGDGLLVANAVLVAAPKIVSVAPPAGRPVGVFAVVTAVISGANVLLAAAPAATSNSTK